MSNESSSSEPYSDTRRSPRLSSNHRGKRAVGVEYIPNPRFHSTGSQDVLIAGANRYVVVSAGSMGSPLILERSGVGSEDVLAKVGVTTIVDLPGVGDKYQGISHRFWPMHWF